MIALFKGSFTIDGENFPAGEHVIGKEVKKHWYLQGLIADGLVVVLKDDEVIGDEEAVEEPTYDEVIGDEEAVEEPTYDEVIEAPKTRSRKKA